MDPLKRNIISSAHISPELLLIIWLNMCLCMCIICWSEPGAFIFLVLNRRKGIWDPVQLRAFVVEEAKPLTVLQYQNSPCINSNSALDFIYSIANGW